MRLSSMRLIIAAVLCLALLVASAGVRRTASAYAGASSIPATSADEKANGGNPKLKRCKGKGESKNNEKGKDKERCLPRRGSSSGIAKADFNGDGFGDLAIGTHLEDINGVRDTGAVHIIYGSSAGLSATAGPGDQFFTLDIIHGPGVSQIGAKFGLALAAGDFNGDGKSDLAIGSPGLDQLGQANAGEVDVLYGSANGLTTAGKQFFIQGFAGLLDAAEAGDNFGNSLAWGDFDGDGFGDLVVGVPDEDLGDLLNAGAAHIIYGSIKGLTITRNQFFTQDSPGIADLAEAGDRFGDALAGGDFNGDGKSDLAIGAPEEGVIVRSGTSAVTVRFAGAVNVIYGSSFGLVDTFNRVFSQATDGILDDPEEADIYGSSLAAGDFNGDGETDLAIGVPFEDIAVPFSSASINVDNAGAVNVLYGSTASGLTATGNQFWTQDSNSVLDNPEDGDFFGFSLAAGDFNGDGRRDLAIGAPFEDIGAISLAGAVNVIYGSSVGLRAFTVAGGLIVLTNQFFTQSTDGVLDVAEEFDSFGQILTAWDFGNGAPSDLAIGVPNEDLGSFEIAGAVNVLYGSTASNGLTTTGNQFWTQDSPGIENIVESGDAFGSALY